MEVRDLIVAPCWLGVNLLLGVSAWRWSLVLFPDDGLFQRILHCLVFWWGCVIAAGTTLGCLGLLSGYFFIGTAACLGLLLHVSLPSHTRRQEGSEPMPKREADCVWAVGWTGLG